MKLREWAAEAAMVFCTVEEFGELTLLEFAARRREVTP